MIRIRKFIHLKWVDFMFYVDAKKDLIALRALQQTTPLEIRSCPSILSSLDQLLIDRCSFMYNNRLSCYATKIQSLARAQIQLDTYTGGDRRLIKVYTRYGLSICILGNCSYFCCRSLTFFKISLSKFILGTLSRGEAGP